MIKPTKLIKFIIKYKCARLTKSREYKIKAIWDSPIYAKKSESGHLLELYNLVSWKGYPKKENIWEPISAGQHLRKFISLFYKDHLNKLTVIFAAINTVLLITRLTIKPITESIK